MTTVDATKKNIFLNDGSHMNDDDDDVFVIEVCEDDESLSIVSSLEAADNAVILRCCIDLGFLCAEREGRPNGAGRQWFLHCIAD